MVRLLRDAADGLRGHFGVGAGTQLDALVDKARAQAVRVHERAIVRERDERLVDGRNVRLRGLPRRGGAGRGIARMPDGDEALERGQARFVEHLGDQAQVL